MPRAPIKLPEIAVLDRIMAYDAEQGILTWKEGRRRGLPAESMHRTGYLMVRIDGRAYLVHRIAWKLWFREEPPEEIDHINRIKTDNIINNLRAASRSVQMHNRYRDSGREFSYPKGVEFHSTVGRFRARITVNGIRHRLGWFDNPEAAHEAYVQAARHLVGSIVRTD